ncbi:MAG: hypothetical protein ABGY71_03575 [bacterium]|nr:hypothetical protein [Planctomycetota bacterium]
MRRGKTYFSPRLMPSAVAGGMDLPKGFESQAVRLSQEAIEVAAQVRRKLECRSGADCARLAIHQGLLPRDA